MTTNAKLRSRTWKAHPSDFGPHEHFSFLAMVNPPEGWDFHVQMDIDRDFEDVEKDGKKSYEETPESEAKDRTFPWIIVALNEGPIGPRCARVEEAMAWAENFADDIQILRGDFPDRLGIVGGNA